MEIEKLESLAKNNTWSNVNSIIESSSLELVLIQNLPFVKMWEVKNHKEINNISNTMKYCGQNIADVKFLLNY